MNEKQNNPLTADQTLKKWCEYTYPSLPDVTKMALQTACERYAAQQVKQVTEERDKPIRLLDRVYELLADGYTIDQSYPIADHIKEFLNSLNAAKEGAE